LIDHLQEKQNDAYDKPSLDEALDVIPSWPSSSHSLPYWKHL